MKDGDIFSREKVAKGLENLRKAYGEYGYINFTSVPDTKFDEEKKLVFLDDRHRRRQAVLRAAHRIRRATPRRATKSSAANWLWKKGRIYNSQSVGVEPAAAESAWAYFEQLKPDDPNVTETQLDEKNGTVDLTLKVKEKGKNSIGLNGGVSGLAGAFIGLNYTTNNFLGLGETLQVQTSIGNLAAQRACSASREPYLFDRPLQFGFTVFTQQVSATTRRGSYAIFTGQQLNLPNAVPAKPAELFAVEHGLHRLR